MAIEILLPKTDSGIEKGEVAHWHADNGSKVREGQPLFTLDAQGAISEVVAPATGTLKITGATGVAYEAGTVLGYIESEL